MNPTVTKTALPGLARLTSDIVRHSRAARIVNDGLGVVLDKSCNVDAPVPVQYMTGFAQLVAQYGTARSYGTVVHTEARSANLPKITLRPSFGLISMSSPIDEKLPVMGSVEVKSRKWGGLFRVPAEIHADARELLGNFLVDVSARQLAKMEDLVFWLADGTATYDSIVGCIPQAVALGKSLQLTSGKTKPSDITLADLRALRGKVASAALDNGAYYMHRNTDKLLFSFNDLAPMTYIPMGPSGEPLLDGYPVRWVSVLPEYNSTAAPGQSQLAFGDASLNWLTVWNDFEFKVSETVAFATDEVLFAAKESFCANLMNDEALAVLKLGA